MHDNQYKTKIEDVLWLIISYCRKKEEECPGSGISFLEKFNAPSKHLADLKRAVLMSKEDYIKLKIVLIE